MYIICKYVLYIPPEFVLTFFWELSKEAHKDTELDSLLTFEIVGFLYQF